MGAVNGAIASKTYIVLPSGEVRSVCTMQVYLTGSGGYSLRCEGIFRATLEEDEDTIL